MGRARRLPVRQDDVVAVVTCREHPDYANLVVSISEVRAAIGNRFRAMETSGESIARLARERDAALAVLLTCEWAVPGDDGYRNSCPCCGGQKPDAGEVPGGELGHRDGCDLAVALVSARAVTRWP